MARARFHTNLTRLRLQLKQAGVDKLSRTKLHDIHAIKVSADAQFSFGHIDFALHVGTASYGKVWACSDGSVIMGSQAIYWPRFEVLDTIKWPLGLQGDLRTPLKPKIEALVLFDIVRWVEKNIHKPFNNIERVVFPDPNHLIAALREYGPQDIVPSIPSTVQVAGPSRRERSSSIGHSSSRPGRGPITVPQLMHEAGGSSEKIMGIATAPPLKEDSDVAFEGVDMSIDQTLQGGEIPEHETVPRNEVKMEPEKQLKSEEEEHSVLDNQNVPNNETEAELAGGHESDEEQENSVPYRETSEIEFSDKPEQSASPATQTRVNGVGDRATIEAVFWAVSPELFEYLPDLTAFHFSGQDHDDYIPIRLQVGVCRDTKSDIEYYLWAYLKYKGSRKRSPDTHFIMSGVVSAQDPKTIDRSLRKYQINVSSSELYWKLESKVAKLLPLFRPFEKKPEELRILARYAYILALEAKKIDPKDLFIPMNNRLGLLLQKVCQLLQSEPPDYFDHSISLAPQLEGSKRDRSQSVIRSTAIDAEFVVDQLPRKPRKAIDKPSGSLTVLPLRPSSSSPRLEGNIEMEDVQRAETRKVIPVLSSRARHHQISTHATLDGNTPRADQHRPAIQDRTPTIPDNENELQERRKSKTPVRALVPDSARSPSARFPPARSASVGSASARTITFRKQASTHRSSSGSRSASVRRTASIQRLPFRTPFTRFHTREATKKQFAQMVEGRRVLGRRVKKDRREGDKNRKGIMDLLWKNEHLRVRGVQQNEKLSSIIRKLEELLKQTLEESSHEFDAGEELLFEDFSSDEIMDGDNAVDEDGAMHEDNSGGVDDV